MKKIITAVCLTVLVLTSCQQAKQKVFEIHEWIAQAIREEITHLLIIIH